MKHTPEFREQLKRNARIELRCLIVAAVLILAWIIWRA